MKFFQVEIRCFWISFQETPWDAGNHWRPAVVLYNGPFHPCPSCGTGSRRMSREYVNGGKDSNSSRLVWWFLQGVFDKILCSRVLGKMKPFECVWYVRHNGAKRKRWRCSRTFSSIFAWQQHRIIEGLQRGHSGLTTCCISHSHGSEKWT